ncbi:uncharacterized protein [Dermacentor albipictus]|uniref:uncharacterized protein n=1 Tax=Dermacentor albipictus TaxID=60249 RepID=UPI0038FC91C5
MLTAEICEHPISIELDTRASGPFMAGKRFKRTFPGVSVEDSGMMLRSYSGLLSQVQGQAQVSVRFGDRATLPLYLTKRSSPTLLRLNWIHALGFCLPEYQEASLHVVKDVPSLLTEFQVPVPARILKRDASVRICEDFMVTINPVIDVEKYPLPGIEDLWSALSGGQKLTKLDLRDAYQQLVLQDASRKTLVSSSSWKSAFSKPPVLSTWDVNSQAGLAQAPRKVDAVFKAPKPQDKKDLQSYLGLINFYKQRYSQLDKEGLALMFGVERFHQYLWDRKFEAVTDHKPLLGLLGPDKAVPVQASHQVPDAVPEPAEVFMLEHAYLEVLSRSAVSQATSRDPVLSQVVKAVSRGE